MKLIKQKAMLHSQVEINNLNKDNQTIILANLKYQKIIETKLMKLQLLEKNTIQRHLQIESLDPLWWLLAAKPLQPPESHRELAQLLEMNNLTIKQSNSNNINNQHHNFKDFLFHAIETKTTTTQVKTPELCQLKVDQALPNPQTNHFLTKTYCSHQHKEVQESINFMKNNKQIPWNTNLTALNSKVINCSNKINTAYPPFQNLVCF